jgi:hypothetical protein
LLISTGLARVNKPGGIKLTDQGQRRLSGKVKLFPGERLTIVRRESSLGQ